MTDPSVLLFLAQGFEDLEAASIIAVCGWTQYRDEIPTVQVVTTAFHEEVRGRFGLTIRPDLSTNTVDPEAYAALAIPGGFHSHGFDEAYDPRVQALANSIHGNGGTIATMCVGVLPVAEAGLLRGKEATTYPHSRHHDNVGRLRELGCIPTPGPIQISDRIISCAGPGQAIDVAFLLLERLIGVEGARKVGHYMICDPHSQPGHLQTGRAES